MSYRLLFSLITISFSVLSMKGQDVQVETRYGTFGGEWHLVPGEKLAIIIPGSGSIDRNGNTTNMEGNSLLYLADSLNAHGISTLNTDKLNLDPSQIVWDSTLDYSAFVELASRWIEVAMDSGYEKITLIGHSQGALTALMLANEDGVEKVVSLCGAGRRINDILIDQITPQISEEYHEGIREDFDSLRLGFYPKPSHFVVASFVSGTNADFLRSWDMYDPCDFISTTAKPVLIISGENDIQVEPSEAERLKSCNEEAQVLEMKGMGHMLKLAPGIRNFAIPYYNRPDLPLHPELAKAIAGFIKC